MSALFWDFYIRTYSMRNCTEVLIKPNRFLSQMGRFTLGEHFVFCKRRNVDKCKNKMCLRLTSKRNINIVHNLCVEM